MSGAEGEPKDLLVEVQNWLAENERVIRHANELTLCDFAYNLKNHSGKFSVSVDGEASMLIARNPASGGQVTICGIGSVL